MISGTLERYIKLGAHGIHRGKPSRTEKMLSKQGVAKIGFVNPATFAFYNFLWKAFAKTDMPAISDDKSTFMSPCWRRKFQIMAESDFLYSLAD